MNRMKFVFFITVALVAVIISGALFYVDERQRALLDRFGEIVRTDFEPGLHFKIPFINNVKKFDARIQTLDSPPSIYLTKEKKKVKVDSFAKWRIKDLKKFYTSLNVNADIIGAANSRLTEIINNGLRAEFGKREVIEVVSGERQQIMDIITKSANKVTLEKYGFEVIDVRIKRVDLPTEVNDSVYRRMESERQRIAKELRSEGQEQAERIKAEVDRKRIIIIADAYRESEKTRGDGDAKASEIYATAYNSDAEFYRFYRSLIAYESSFNSKNDLLLLDTKSRFFDFFKNQQ